MSGAGEGAGAGKPDPEVRIDQLTGLRTILAPARAARPFDFSQALLPKLGGTSAAESEGGPPRAAPGREAEEAPPTGCPFCGGHEAETPPELWANRPGEGSPDGPGWRVRAVPNLYPALAQAEEAPAAGASDLTAPRDPLLGSARQGQADLFATAAATGSHEVIVHTPRHRRSLGELDREELEAAVAGWRERMRAHGEAACLALIVNEGPGAGASLEHTHAQLYALSFVPVAVARERERFSAYQQRVPGGQLLADVASEEVRRRERLVAIDEDSLLICPWASRSPFELRLIPRRPSPRFEDEDGIGVAMLGRALRALRERLGGHPQLNLWVRTAPRDADTFGWHLDIAPRLSVKAGFELSTGVDINVYPPERAAAELRQALGDG